MNEKKIKWQSFGFGVFLKEGVEFVPEMKRKTVFSGNEIVIRNNVEMT